MHLINI